MGSAQRAALAATLWRPWSAQSRAKVTFLLGEQRAAERIARQLFGRELLPNEYAGLAGAPDNALVEAGASDGRLYLEMRDPVTATCGYYYLYCERNAIVLLNDGFRINVRVMRGQGLGLQIFCRQTHHAAALGVNRIETVAGRNNDENGYCTWPRYGFQGMLPASVRHLLPLGLEQSHTILDLMSHEKGRDWWREHGVTIPVRFDLAPGSRSRRTLARYVRERILGNGPKRNIENASAMLHGAGR
jgi:hypothetical protein